MDPFSKGWIFGKQFEYIKKPGQYYLKGELLRVISVSGSMLKKGAENSYQRLKNRFPALKINFFEKLRLFTKYYEIKGESQNPNNPCAFNIKLFKNKIEVLIDGIDPDTIFEVVE
ncbi:MAG: hypothetical protein ABIL46_09285 [candidate division WOR-3 bacterium]